MQQIDVDRIENEKFIQAQREAQEQADRKARLAFVPVSEEVAPVVEPVNPADGGTTPTDSMTSDAPVAPATE